VSGCRPAPGGAAREMPRLGVDLVSVTRIERALEHGLLRRISDAAELAGWARPDGLDTAAALWAVKEAAVKVAGGRPAGFDWRDIRVEPGAPPSPPVPRWLGAGLGDALGTPATGWSTYHWAASAGGQAAWCRCGPVVVAVGMGWPPPAAA
jgi:4'-phosphopantetheinyl transferase superfamily protein